MRISVLLAALVSLPALAAPPDRILELAPGSAPAFERSGTSVRIHVVDPKIVSAESLPSGEVVLEPKGRGETLVFLHSREGVGAWRVLVGEKRAPVPDAALTRAKTACAAFSTSGGTLEVTVSSAACLAALEPVVASFSSRRTLVSYDQPGLTAQLEAHERALAAARPDLAKNVKLAYMGGTLRIEGTFPSTGDFNAVVRALWHSSVARLLLDVEKVTVQSSDPAPTSALGQDAATEVVKGPASDELEVAPMEESADEGEPAEGVEILDGYSEEDDSVEVISGFDEKKPPR